jgi:CheY-like chemotaxis protein
MAELARSLTPAVDLPVMTPHGDSDPSPTILIVEDDRETRQFYIGVLTANGFHTEEAHNGFQAFEKATVMRPALVLTDIAVPGFDGIELCRRLRADVRTRDIPVLAITGYDDRHYQARARQAGANNVLLKPIHADALCTEARRLLSPDLVDVHKTAER